MKIIDPRVEVWQFDSEDIMRRLELAGRTCYKSEQKITKDSAGPFLERAIARGHESILEHCSVTVKFVVDRGISHDLVRHRIAAYSQESTRYCRYGDQITVIRPFFWAECSTQERIWHDLCLRAEGAYLALLNAGASPQQARTVLPNSLKTEIVATYNIREWRHVLVQRCSTQIHPQMRQVMIPLLLFFASQCPSLFEDVPFDAEFPANQYAGLLSYTNMIGKNPSLGRAQTAAHPQSEGGTM